MLRKKILFITLLVLPHVLLAQQSELADSQSERPRHTHHGRPPFLKNLTSEQKNCLDERLGKPHERESRPSREEMDAAFSECNIEKPSFRRESEAQEE